MSWDAECTECRAWLTPPRTTLCASCEDKVNAYANAAIKRDKLRGPSGYTEMSTCGRYHWTEGRAHGSPDARYAKEQKANVILTKEGEE